MSLKDYDTEELEAELLRRQASEPSYELLLCNKQLHEPDFKVSYMSRQLGLRLQLGPSVAEISGAQLLKLQAMIAKVIDQCSL